MPHDKSLVLRLLMDERFRVWVHHPTPMLDRYWEQHLLHYPEERIAIEQAREVLRNIDFPKSQQIDKAGILSKALDRAKNTQDAFVPLVPQPRSSRRFFAVRHWHQMAAVLTGLALLVGLWFYASTKQVHATSYGESERIMLPDGSTVILNANSELRYRRAWDKDTPRQVTLIGEAFFSVTQQANRQKFIVQANHLAIEVLGTEFNVNNRRGETKVMLQKGSVRLDWSAHKSPPHLSTDTIQQLIVEPGELVIFSENELTRKVVNPQVYTAWTTNQWRFEETPLTEVLTLIEDNFGYQIVAEDKVVANKVFTAEIHEADLDLLLTFLSESFELAIVKSSDTITIRKKRTIDS